MQYLGYKHKNDRMISVRFQGKPFNITVIQVYVPTTNAEEAEFEWFYEDLSGESHGGRSLVGYSPWGPKESNTTEQCQFHFHYEDLQDLLEHPQKMYFSS